MGGPPTSRTIKWPYLTAHADGHFLGNPGEPRNQRLSIGNPEFSSGILRVNIGNAKVSVGNTECSIRN